MPRRVAAFVLAFALSAVACKDDPNRELSDSALQSIANRYIRDAEWKPLTDRVVGRYHGEPVRMLVTCADVCPHYATRILYIDREPCPENLGVDMVIGVPVAAASSPTTFCVPKPLASHYEERAIKVKMPSPRRQAPR